MASKTTQAPGSSGKLRTRIRAFLLARLLGGDWPAGHRVPSESELMAQFGASRMTVHGVLRELQALGYLERGAGVGSFVAEPKVHSSVISIADPADEIRSRQQAHALAVVRTEQRALQATDGLAAFLEAGAPVDHLLLLHLADGAPAILEDRLVNPAMMPGLLELDLARTSPFVALMRRYPFPDSRHRIRAVAATAEDAALLAIPPASPCLELTRTTFVTGRPVTHVRLLYPGDTAAISGSVERKA